MIYLNQTLQYVTDLRRIRIIEILDSYVYVVNLDTTSAMPYRELYSNLLVDLEQGVLLTITDPYAVAISDSELTSTQIKKRDEDWVTVEKYILPNISTLLNKASRGEMLLEIVAKSGLGKTKVKKVLSRYWQRGMNKNAMLPDYSNSGGKGKLRKLSKEKVGRPRRVTVSGELQTGINITDEVKQQFSIAINKYYRKKNNYTLTDVYYFILRDFFSDRYKENGEQKYRIWESKRIPSYNQFYYWFKKLEDPKKDIEFRKSTKEYDLKYRPLLSNAKQETNGPGTRFQIDATIADIYLVSMLNPNMVIGRPVVYAIMDVYSRIIAGVYVGLEGPSWIGAMMALDNMMTDKVEFCKKYNIEITEEQWPTKHLPEIIIADRGEFEGYAVEGLINNLNIKIENTAAYRGDLKGIVERQFRTMNGKIKQKSPGAIQKEYRERGDRDYRLDAMLNLKEFSEMIITLVLQHNHKIIDKYPMEKEMITDGLVPTPINLWNWGIQNRKGRLRTVDRNVLRLNVLPRGNATISRAGIKFKNMLYGSKKALEEEWYLKLRNKRIEVAYDPRDVSNIYVPNDNGRAFESCFLLETSEQYKEEYLEEITFHHHLQKELEEEERHNQLQLNIDTETMLNSILNKAKKKRTDKTLSAAQKVRTIRENRATEKLVNRASETFNLFSSETLQKAEIINFPAVKNNNVHPPTEETNDDLMDFLTKKRDELYDKE